jgi:predicted dehydrogenase
MEQYPDIKHYTDFDEMLSNESLDILDICLPTYMHVDFSIKAMEKGINVICEKPISLHKEDVKRAYDTAKKNNVKFMVAQVVRWMPNFAFVKEVYDSGKYGKLLSGAMNRLGCIPVWSWDNWMADEKRSGLVSYDLHVHDADFMVYTFGVPKHQTCFRSKLPDQDYIHAVYEFDGFFIDSSSSWYASPYPFTVTFRFQFENAIVAFENGEMKVYERSGEVLEIKENATRDTGNDNVPKSNGYALEIRYFTDCVKNNVFPEMVKPEELEAVIDILNKI